MKYTELKRRFKNKYVIRVAAGVLTIALLGTGAGMYSVHAQNANKEASTTEESKDAEDTVDLSEADDETKEEVLTEVLDEQVSKKDSQAGKEETVYVVADASGNKQEVIVSEWLKNQEGSETLADATDLKDIKNVKGNEEYTENSDGTITWQAGGNDIYYQGTTDKELPVDMKITYTLDGKEISPQELAGKSGKVTIRMDYTNKEKVEATVNGKQEEVCVPFTAVSGMILSDKFSNVEVTNGKLISDGRNQVVVGVAMPGLSDSLKVESKDFDTDVEIPEYVEVSADVEDFSMDMTMTMIMSDVLSDLQLTDSLDLSELEDSIDTLSDASGQLVNGSGELADGLDTLKGSMDEYASGVNTLKEGVNSYTAGAAQLNDGITTLKNGTDALAGGAGTLAEGVSKISDSFTSDNGLKNGAKALADGVNQLDTALNTAMTDEEKKQVAEKADAAVDKTFEDGAAAQIAQQAAAQFEETMEGNKDTISAQLGEQLVSSDLYSTMVEAMYQKTIFEAYQVPETKAAVDAAIAAYASQGVTISIEQVIEQTYQEGNDGQTLRSVVEAQVAQTLKDTVAPTIAGGIADGIAASGKDSMGASVAAACQQAAKTAAETAAVTGAEGAKAQIAAQIEQGGLVAGASALSSGVNQLYEEGISPLKNGVDSMVSQMPTLIGGIQQLSDGSAALVSNNQALTDGAKKLSDATAQISDGVNQLEDGSTKLAEGMAEFDEDGIQKLADTYHGDVKTLLDRVDAVMDAGKSYHTFTKLSDGVDGSVKFIIRTEAIEAE